MRILGIDFGESKIGIAMSDPMGWIATGLELIRWSENIKPVLIKIKEIVQKNEISEIVVGFPKNMNGTIGERAERTIWFVSKLKEVLPDMNIVQWDERLTTSVAKKTMSELGLSIKKKKQVEDQIAASFLLQGYLDFKKR